MTTLRWKKIMSDLWINRSRSFLAALAMVIGVIGLGAVLCAYGILMRELDANYMRTNPASIVITVQPATKDLVNAVRNFPGVGEAEPRGFFQARVSTKDNEWKTLLLFVIDDFSAMRISKSKPEAGTWPPGKGEILIERAAFRVIDTNIDDSVTVRLPGVGEQRLRIAGSAHDPAQAPAWMEGLAYGYVTRETLAMFGDVSLNGILLTVAERPLDKVHIRSVAKSVTDWMEREGYRVQRIEVPEPGHHPHQTQLKALLFLLETFGGLSFILSAVLVITLFGAIMAQQVRQIGVMKAIGARTGQMAAMYLCGALLLGSIAVLVGVPLSVVAARLYSTFAAGMLNFEIVDASVPLWTYLALVGIGLVTPALAALYPVYRGSRITVREAIADYGINSRQRTGSGFLDRLFAGVKGLPRPLLLSLRNTFRRKGRIALTLGTLAIGGAMFITALNIGASITKTIGVFQNAMRYDLRVSLTKPLPIEEIAAVAAKVQGVTRVEGWGRAKASLLYDDGTEGNEFPIMAPPPETDLLRLGVIEGRWLTPSDERALVVNHIFMARQPHLKIGDEVVLRIEGEKTPWRIVGVIRQIGEPTAFANYSYLASAMNQKGLARTIAVVTQERSMAAHRIAAKGLEQAFKAAGIDVTETISIYDIQRILEDHFLVLTMLLLFMSALIVVVGGLGLMTTMSIQVIERTREIGVMRSIGASSHELLKIIGIEGLVLGMLSWLIALVLALPISKYVGDIFGMIFLQTTLDYALSPFGFVLWLGVVVIFSLAASFIPARKATRLTVRETLAYE
ncbi:MAG: FtsX-like permease family protein [Deltaproteobacteria bacterium]|nr:FtsX-like permease family protein [Deltaproteobacteria bacterium]